METTNYMLAQFFKSGQQSLFTLTDIFMAMFVTVVMCLMLTYTYRATHRGTSYSANFILSMFLMSVATGVVMIIIGSNVARAFSLVGALSIIRFRTAMKDPRDTAFLFVAIVGGMGAGTGFYIPVLCMSIFLCVFALLFDYIKFGEHSKLESVLKISLDEKTELGPIEKALNLEFKDIKLINKVNNYREKEQTHIYVVKPHKKTSIEDVESKLSGLIGVKCVSFYNSDQHAPF